MEEYMSKQGNLGLSKAIHFFVSNGYTVSIPINDTQKYDLVVEINGELKRVQVKTSRCTNKNKTSHCVLLKNCGGSSGKSIIRHFNNKSCDYLFVYCSNECCYLIPSEKIQCRSQINVGIKYKEYEVHSKNFLDYVMNEENS